MNLSQKIESKTQQNVKFLKQVRRKKQETCSRALSKGTVPGKETS
jgi:hypothetical protein